MTETRITKLLGVVEYPVLQGGMAWIADARTGGRRIERRGRRADCGGNAPADYVEEQIKKAKTLTDKPFGVNIMLLSPFAAEVCELVAREKVAVVTTGAGNPAAHISMEGCGYYGDSVVPSCALAKRMERWQRRRSGRRGHGGSGHIGELTTMALVPQVTDSVGIPVIAAGGIADGRAHGGGIYAGRRGRSDRYAVPGCAGVQRASEL